MKKVNIKFPEESLPPTKDEIGTFIKLVFYFFKILINRRFKRSPFKRPAYSLPTFAGILSTSLNDYYYDKNAYRKNDRLNPSNFERSSVKMLLSYFNAGNDKFDGSLTSSTSEGILYSMILLKEYLNNKGVNNIFVLKTILTHTAVDNAVDILDLKTFNIDLNSSINLSPDHLEVNVSRLSKKHKKMGVILVLTLGYKDTGTSDHLPLLIKKVRILETKYKVKILLLVDAAYDGFLFPVSNIYSPLDYPEVKTIVFDLHKQFFVPYTSGVVLYRNEVKGNTNFVNGLFETQSSFKAMALWAFLRSQGLKGIKDIHSKNLLFQKFFTNRINYLFGPDNIIYSLEGSYVTLIVGKGKFSEIKLLQDKYPIRCNRIFINNKFHYFVKVYFFTRSGLGLYSNLAAKIEDIYE